MTCIILQDSSGSAEEQPRAAEHQSGLSEGLSEHQTEFIEDPFGSPAVPQRWRTRKNHYVVPPLVPTNLESRSIIKLVSER
jgi:hypothetical protein